MVVLSIVVVPFMHSFITAANTNANAKRAHKATVVAQSVMEGFKAEPLDEIVEQFKTPATDFHILDPDRVNGNLADAVEVVTDPALPGKYRFEIAGVKEDISEYDVLVTLDATSYRDPANTDRIQYNADKLIQLPVIDMDRDAVCIQKPEYTNAAVSQFRGTFIPEPSEAVVRAGMTREITVNVERTNMSGGDHRTRVLVDYKYIYGGVGHTISQVCFDSTETGEELRSVYLYYFPLYGSGVPCDSINYVNNSSLPVNFYLLKQDAGEASAADEIAYHVRLKIEEPGSAEGSMQSKIYTNLGVNIKDNSTLPVDLCEVFLNGSKAALDKISAPELYESAAEDRLYEVKVSVYESGAKATGFPEEKRLATLEGSRID